MKIALETMGAKFDALRARYAELEPGEERDRVCERLSRRAEAIQAIPADDLAGLQVKARAVVWTENLDFAPPDENDQSFVMAGFVQEIARAGVALRLAG